MEKKNHSDNIHEKKKKNCEQIQSREIKTWKRRGVKLVEFLDKRTNDRVATDFTDERGPCRLFEHVSL